MDIDALRLASLLTIRQIDRKADAYADRPAGLSRDVAADVHKILRAARSFARLAVAECNYSLTGRQIKRKAALRKEVDRIARDYGLGVAVLDPRGYTLKLTGLSVSNEMGGAWGLA